MNFPTRVSAVGILWLGLTVGESAHGQGASKGPPVSQSSASPAKDPDVPANAATRAQPARDDLSDTAPSSATTKDKVGRSDTIPAPGGYSWREKRSKRVQGGRAVTLDPNRTLVHAPNFEIKSDGTSVLTLALSHKTDVTRVVNPNHVEYHIKDAQVGVNNNLNPLVTSHFASPLERALLKRQKGGVTLLLLLRENVQPLHRVRIGPADTAILEVIIPRPTRTYPVAAPRAPESASVRSTQHGSNHHLRRPDQRNATKVELGPRL